MSRFRSCTTAFRAFPALSLAALLTASAALSPSACAAEKILRLGYILSTSSQLGAGVDVFSAEVAKRTSGHVRIEAYPDAMLGGEVEMMRDVQLGALDLAFVTGAPLPSVVPAAGIFNIPFLFRDAEQARQILDGPIGDEYLAKFDKAGLVALAWGENGMRQLSNSQRDIRSPDDLKGLKLRLPQSDAMTVGFQALGADVQQIPFNQLYGALQSGRVDAQENPIATILSSHFSQVQSHLTLTAHVYDPAIILMSRDAFEALSADDQGSFKEAARLAGLRSREFASMQERTGVATLRAQGMTVVDTIDRSAFARRADRAAPRWDALYGAAEIERLRTYGLASGDRSSHAASVARP